MPDITMCKGTQPYFISCKDKDNCYRCQAIPDLHWQAWFVELPRKDNDTPCEYFIPMAKKDTHV